jgi:acetyl esterase/lipase
MHSINREHPSLVSRRIFVTLAAVVALIMALVATPAASAVEDRVLEVEVHTGIAYKDPVPATTQGNLLDLYIPQVAGDKPLPLIIWTSGSAWFSDNGKAGAAPIAEIFNQQRYAVAGVSVRSSFQVQFPGQLFDIRAAVRWLRQNASDYGIDPNRIAIMGNSSGGWVSAITATTSDIAQLPGEPDVGNTSSGVQVAVPFFPPTDFLQMNSWFVDNPGVPSFIDHDSPTSPESFLIGCAIQTCPNETQLANPITYVQGSEIPIMLLHGEFDQLVPNGQSVLLFEALADAGSSATFISVPGAGHSVNQIIGAADFTVFKTRANQVQTGDSPAPSWESIEQFISAAFSL